jgi:hypothetical protein
MVNVNPERLQILTKWITQLENEIKRLKGKPEPKQYSFHTPNTTLKGIAAELMKKVVSSGKRGGGRAIRSDASVFVDNCISFAFNNMKEFTEQYPDWYTVIILQVKEQPPPSF